MGTMKGPIEWSEKFHEIHCACCRQAQWGAKYTSWKRGHETTQQHRNTYVQIRNESRTGCLHGGGLITGAGPGWVSCDQGDNCIHCSNERQEVVMGTSITALAQLVNCVLDCRGMRDLRRRRKEAVQIFIQRRSAGCRCLRPFANDHSDRSFPIYAPLLFMSLDRLLCGDFGLVPAFFGQMPEELGKHVGTNS